MRHEGGTEFVEDEREQKAGQSSHTSASANRFGARSQAIAERYRLSPREREILLLLVRGVRQKEIGGVVGCAYSSVRTHISRMSSKLGCSGTTELVLRFFDGS